MNRCNICTLRSMCSHAFSGLFIFWDFICLNSPLPHFFVKFDEPFKNDRLGKTKYEGIMEAM